MSLRPAGWICKVCDKEKARVDTIKTGFNQKEICFDDLHILIEEQLETNFLLRSITNEIIKDKISDFGKAFELLSKKKL